MISEDRLVEALASAALAGEWTAASILDRFGACVGLEDLTPHRWLMELGPALILAHPERPLEPRALHASFDAALEGLFAERNERALERFEALRIMRWLVPEPYMRAAAFEVPALLTSRDVADLLDVELGALAWLADPRGLNPNAGAAKLHHYRCRWIPKRSGGARLIEAPKPRLARAQRNLLDRVLVAWPVHAAACAFVRGRGVLDHARAHVARRVVVRMDLENYFWSIGFARVRGVLRAAGYPPGPSGLLAGLATTSTPEHVLRAAPDPSRRDVLRTLRRSHLPQGAPSSPMLANLCTYRLDLRLSGIAARFGATYTRYADDLAFSGGIELDRTMERFLPRVGAIVIEEGFVPNHRKTRVMRAGRRQELCGIVVNEHLSIQRAELERLEATLVNCARLGPSSQNRHGHADLRAHLEGRVGWVEQVHPGRGAKLRGWLRAIDWEA